MGQQVRTVILSTIALLSLIGCGSGIAGTSAVTATSLQVASTLPNAVSGMMYNSSLQASGSSTNNYSWEVASGAVPDGLELQKTSGVISGVPTSAGTADFSVTVKDNLQIQPSRTVPVSIKVVPQLAVKDISMPDGKVGTAYTRQLTATGGQAPYTWSVADGKLPPGITASNGTVSGKPTVAGTYTFNYQVRDSGFQQVLSLPLVVTIAPQNQTVAPLTVAPVALQTTFAGSPFSLGLNATGGTPAYTWSLASGSLPNGITLSSTGVLSGTPTAAGTYSAKVAVKDSTSPTPSTASTTVSFSVAAPLTLQAPAAASATVNSPFSASFLASGGTPAYTWTTSGTLPAGLSMNAGVLSGTPTAAGSYTFTVKVADASNPVQTRSATSTVVVAASPLSLQVPTLPSATVSSPFTASFLASGGTPAYTWSTSGTLPAGLSMNAGVLSGTPTTAGSYTFTVQVADGSNQTRSATATLTVANAPQAIAAGTTWYVRKDGGTRYSANRTNGQCDGKSDTPYSGIGVNQHCAFNDVRLLWQDGSYTNSVHPSWVIAGGDTVIVRGSLESNTTYRIGWNNQSAAYEASTDTFWGVAGDPYGSGIPVPPSGTASQHTRILGENYGSCHTQSKRTQLHGGYGVSAVLDLHGASYVDVQCFDITDFSACGRSAQSYSCAFNPGTLDDYAANGITVDKNTNHINVTDVRIHGMAVTGMYGPTGDGNIFSYFDLVGNPGAGWNADNGTVGVGSTLVQNFNISWNGCAEEYPIRSALPYNDCTDDNSGGYGDGFGTATINATVPWNITFDNGTVSYNTQDGLDALHLTGAGSTMTINRVLAYGNMGQQIKVGGAGGVATNNVIVTNCNAMRQAIPGTPSGFNQRLSDYCRAADAGIVMSVQDGSMTRFDNNTVYSASSTTIEIDCSDGGCKSGTDQIDFRNNIILGFKNTAANGYVNGGTEDYANPIYVGGLRTFLNSGSVYDHNLTYHAKSNWSCPNNPGLRETNAICADPGLVDETWHNYGVGTMSPVPGVSLTIGAGISVPGLTTSFNGQVRATPPTIGAYE